MPKQKRWHDATHGLRRRIESRVDGVQIVVEAKPGAPDQAHVSVNERSTVSGAWCLGGVSLKRENLVLLHELIGVFLTEG